MYFLSSNTNLPTNITNGIDFNIIDKYEPSHTNYVEDIHPNTYASVRGEVLVQILNTMFNLFMSHQHQPTEPLVQDDKNFQNLKRLIETLENDMLNKSIRIN